MRRGARKRRAQVTRERSNHRQVRQHRQERERIQENDNILGVFDGIQSGGGTIVLNPCLLLHLHT